MAVDLSANDVVMPICYTRILLVYDYRIENLEKSFLDFLEIFCPDAFGQIVADPTKPNSSHLIPAEGNRERIYKNSQQNDVSVQHYIEGSFQDFDVFPYTAIPTNETPLVFLHQIDLNDGTILAFGSHHQWTDGHGFFTLIDRFSRWFRNPQDPTIEHLIHDRSLLKPSDQVDYEHHEYTTEARAFSFTTLPEMEVIVEKLQKQKVFEKLSITNQNLSFNDVLVGWLTQSISRIRKIPEDETVKILMAANGRDALKLGPNYFGNCNFYMSIPFPMKDLNSKTVNELAEHVNQEKKKFLDEKYIRSAMAWVRSASSQVLPSAKSFCGTDLAFTNWSRFPVYQINFGQGTPKRMTLPAARFDGLTLILPTATDEVEVYIGLIKEHAEELLKQF